MCCILVGWEWRGSGPVREQPSAAALAYQVISLLGMGAGIQGMTSYVGNEHMDYVNGYTFMGIHLSLATGVLQMLEPPLPAEEQEA